MKLRSLGITAGTILAAAVAWGQDVSDPPSRVARLNYIYGAVSFRPASLDEWAQATLNYPLSTGDHLWTDSDSQAELHVGPTALRLAPQTAFVILTLDDHVFQTGITQGALNIHLPRLSPEESYEVDTPQGAITLREAGTYRIDVSADSGVTLLTVRAGLAEAIAGGQTYPVAAGRMLRLFDGDPPTADTVEAAAMDPWDQWCAARDRADQQAETATQEYVSPDMTGAEDLAAYGDWEQVPDYGPGWCPRGVPVGWTPYGNGHWIYKLPWGWTWVDDAPWGFAPFHFGRWAFVQGHWVWLPGARPIKTVYAPALVSFTRGSGNGVGWIPLGPREPFHPGYKTSSGYLARLNGNTDPRVQSGLANRNHATLVSREVFAGARPVAPARERSSGGAAEEAPSVKPLPASLLGRSADSGRRVSLPPTRSERTLMVRHEVPAETGAASVQTRPASRRPEVAPAAAVPAQTGDETRRQQEIQRRSDDQRRSDGQRQEQQRQAESQRQQDDQRRVDAQRQSEVERKQEQQRQIESQRQQDEQRRSEAQRQEQQRQEQQRQAEMQRQQEEQRRAEGQRQEQQRQAEMRRQQEEQHRAESQRQAEMQRQQEEQRRAESQRQEQQRQQEEQRRADSQRQAEMQRQLEQQRQAEMQRQQEQQRQAEAQRQEQQRQAEAQRQEHQRQQEEQRRQEDQRKQDEAARKKQ